MATITITIPESANVTAEQFVVTAASHWGWAASSGITAEEYILDRFEEQLYAHFRSGQRTLSRDELEAELPPPESRGIRAHRDREAAREAAERAPVEPGGASPR